MSKFNEWFMTQSTGWDTVDPEDAWDAAIKEALRVMLEHYDKVPYEVFEAVNGLRS